ncbi:flavodoxin family protein [Victivallis sp. Marseille-Q1083]|uniref:flavodoxin family protein n=1 Tax=Victivallis sp. Marseille-Q1083 TaxID=2717288 RepID=UPI00158A6CF0|nr:flavodoxin family protein [Victivallis sp. Marseille-Q1083]
MNQNVLLISSSPRRGGNSDLLCDQFALGAKEAGNSVEKVFLKDLEINFCTGCGVCNTTHQCVLKDDEEALLAKLVAADVIVIATPVYFYTVSAQLKVMIDRLCPRYTEIADKTFYLIATAAEDGEHTFDGTIAAYRGMLDCLPGSSEGGRILCGGAWQIGEVKNLSAMHEAYAAGKNI